MLTWRHHPSPGRAMVNLGPHRRVLLTRCPFFFSPPPSPLLPPPPSPLPPPHPSFAVAALLVSLPPHLPADITGNPQSPTPALSFYLCPTLLTFSSGYPDGVSLPTSITPPLVSFSICCWQTLLSPHKTPTQHHMREKPVSFGPERNEWRLSQALSIAVMMNPSDLLVDLKMFSSPKGLPSVNRTKTERGERMTQTNETHSTVSERKTQYQNAMSISPRLLF